jgi:hypothetical protein
VSLWASGSEEEKRTWQQSAAQRLLAAVVSSGGTLSAESLEMVVALQKEIGAGSVGITGDDLPPGRVLLRSPESDASEYGDLQGAELLAAIERKAADELTKGGEATDALIRTDPDRVLRALLANRDGAHGVLWDRLLWRLAQPDWLKAARAETKADVLRAIAAMSPDALAQAADPAARWLEDSVGGKDEEILPFLTAYEALALNAWSHVAGHVLNAGDVEEAAFGPGQGERLMGQALNSAAGVVAFVGLVLADRGRRHAALLPTIASAREDIEDRLARTQGPARLLVAARLSEWLHVAMALMPRAARRWFSGRSQTSLRN